MAKFPRYRAATEPPAPLAAACRDVVAGRRASDLLRRWAHPHGLSDLQLRLLHELALDAPRDQASLAATLLASPARVSAVVLQLGTAGLIESTTDPSDRRRQLWRLTAAGNRCVAAVSAAAQAELATASADEITPQEDAA
ncbi:MAG: winged helix-turn-helix transcriptional regulator [Planctomycetales bacterium]|nr:winged helix-turn-helix transcriptional regulator [Planctomycetales bacterium]